VKKNPPSARRAALEALLRWEQTGAFADTIVEERIRPVIRGPDSDLAVEIFYGSIRWRARLDFLIDRSTFEIKDLSIRCLLRCGLYQLIFLDRVPEYAAVDETVGLAPAGLRNLVNAFLRSFLRERKEWLARLEACRADNPEVHYSQPAWLIRRWEQAFGADRARRLLEWNNSIPGVFVRANTLKGTPENLKLALAEHGPKATAHPLALQIESPGGLFSTPAFRDGLFYVQDPSTLKAVDLLDPQPGESILEPCAAPGGKTTDICQRMANRGRIVASDAAPERLRLVDENLKRLACTAVETIPMAALLKTDEKFDRILLDVPCSNTGVLRRRVDLRWRIRLEQIPNLAREQVAIGLRFAARLKPGGVLVYSTCSLEPEENGQVIDRLQRQIRALQLKETWESFPPESGLDGAFVAKFKMKKSK
jgi:16S rRNA (cytosine967-C5)-methyltransferase